MWVCFRGTISQLKAQAYKESNKQKTEYMPRKESSNRETFPLLIWMSWIILMQLKSLLPKNQKLKTTLFIKINGVPRGVG